VLPEKARTWIIGYGNPHRRDDGIGGCIVERLQCILRDEETVTIRAFHQLDPTLIEDLHSADRIVLVDATVHQLEDGWQRVRVRPESGYLPYSMHHFRPPLLLGLIQSLYHKCPETWLVSVQGSDFGHGEGLSGKAKERVEKASRAIAAFVSMETH
jgi:hydrogenase maturation protease